MTFLFERAPGISKEADDWSASVREVGGMEPSTVLRSDQAWEIHVHWQEQGAAVIPGNWVVDAYLESIGPGAEMVVGQAVDPFAGPGSMHDVTILVAAGAVPVTPGQNTTPYFLVITLTANNAAGAQYAMAGFEMGPVLQFYIPV